ncbi:mechanosensitive ion channel family protein [Spirochaeta thermophila]|uniref:MscS Mechanosensitive ion channel n=1 Tax=Winmispira thermophila (strain ATCC 49972 / DSM 6192 / RI 19.B1) TaxID=665571 RepID=E0RTI3_WINT6|nr:mechanosensitive ion channel domain-containing protein [Spirochaeta thermophila]ADN02214.1 hypothetical protein STHERM_c12730 [Spirochaeta thermophila DSM 6192]
MDEMWKALITFLSKPLSIGGLDFPFTVGDVVLSFLLPLVGAVLLYRVLTLVFAGLLQRSSFKEETKTRILRWTRRSLRVVFGLLAFFLLFGLFGTRLGEYLGKIYEVLNEPLYSTGDTRISLITLILLIPVFYAASVSGNLVRRLLEHSILQRVKGMDPSRRFTLVNLARYLTIVLTSLIGLSFIGINLSSLMVLLGVLGLGIGFGLQSVVANFFAGLIIISTRPIKEGDRILVGDIEGTVHEIRMLTTVVNTLFNESIILPNSKIVQEAVYNFSHYDRRVVLRNPVQVSYKSDVRLVEKVLIEVGERCPYRVKSRPPVVYLNSFDDSGITFTLYTWISNVDEKYPARSWINFAIWEAFKAHGIEIPYPQRDVYIRYIASSSLKE